MSATRLFNSLNDAVLGLGLGFRALACSTRSMSLSPTAERISANNDSCSAFRTTALVRCRVRVRALFSVKVRVRVKVKKFGQQ